MTGGYRHHHNRHRHRRPDSVATNGSLDLSRVTVDANGDERRTEDGNGS
ncbi:hypothetical protein OB955_12125 [Halobacteria archaeon AArc-m2/3/4]|uniref:Uncharacterized protein n=1 Tax=Natronoglomus mannanivorans TaxID=2979990 RepID=A0AAP3E2A7_9EURY|nr:hypothetical protein [Halobacteria archaeon AArc-xg1-1]MCU4973486.1 hypothetical protein [Halobacteria archaeon AArc-m2/3/4]